MTKLGGMKTEADDNEVAQKRNTIKFKLNQHNSGGRQIISSNANDSSEPEGRTRSLKFKAICRETDEKKPNLIPFSSSKSDGKTNWLLLSAQEEGCRYIPQLGDEVVYVRQVM